jgi:hypothetical protein
MKSWGVTSVISNRNWGTFGEEVRAAFSYSKAG